MGILMYIYIYIQKIYKYKYITISTIAVLYVIFVHFFTQPMVSLTVTIVIKCFTTVSQIKIANNARCMVRSEAGHQTADWHVKR